MRVLICGGGVIGAATAYFLGRRGIAATVIERTGIACAASGKSGGFLACDWCDGTPLAPLARRSFALHAQLEREVPGDWGYRRLTALGGMARAGNRRHVRADAAHGWLSPTVAVTRQLGSVDTTAQVDPARFTGSLMRAAQKDGAAVRLGRVENVVTRGGAVAGAVVDGEIVAADKLVVAMGPWSLLAADWLPLPPIYGWKGHSLVFATGNAVPPEALFCDYRERRGGMQQPELFPRSDGTTYVCAISSESPLPLDPAEVAPDPGAIERLEAICRDLSPVLAGARIVARRACFRPVSLDGLPLIGRVPGVAGAYVATGHNVWGMLNAPATGEALAELIAAGATHTLDLAPFDPARMPPLDPAWRSRLAGR